MSERRNTFLEKHSLQHLGHLTAEELQDVWKHYDQDNDGFLTAGELDHLATAAVIRVEARIRLMLQKLVEEEWNRQGKDLSDKEAMEKEVDEGLKEIFNQTSVQQSRSDLLRAMDANADGRISKEEFFSKWNEFAKSFEQAEMLESVCLIL